MSGPMPSNPLHERYASAEMGALFSTSHRYACWRQLWIALAEAQHELGLKISAEQLDTLRAAPPIDFDRVAELERQTRHDVVAHLRHFAEQSGDAGGILHLGATSAFITDNTDLLILRDALRVIEGRLAAVLQALAAFADRHKRVPALAYTHFQPAQLTTVGKRAALWAQEFVLDVEELRFRVDHLRCRGAKGTTGTQASYLALFQGDSSKVEELDRLVAAKLGFAASYPITGQTYPRKLDSQILSLLAGIGSSAHKVGTDLRLLQGVGELSEPFDEQQVGSSAMAYKRNPVRSERMCSLARRLISDSLNGPMTAATQWLERSLDDSANRRLVLADAFLCADAVLSLAAHIADGLRVKEQRIASRVADELPFMATEQILMEAVLRGGDRQELHERIRRYSLDAQAALETGSANPLVGLIAADPDFHLSREEIEAWLDPATFVGRAPDQVDQYLSAIVMPLLAKLEPSALEQPRV